MDWMRTIIQKSIRRWAQPSFVSISFPSLGLSHAANKRSSLVLCPYKKSLIRYRSFHAFFSTIVKHCEDFSFLQFVTPVQSEISFSGLVSELKRPESGY
jgi:hypothetical protein